MISTGGKEETVSNVIVYFPLSIGSIGYVKIVIGKTLRFITDFICLMEGFHQKIFDALGELELFHTTVTVARVLSFDL